MSKLKFWRGNSIKLTVFLAVALIFILASSLTGFFNFNTTFAARTTVSYTIEGQKTDGGFTPGNICGGPGDCYAEGDNVPFKVTITNLTATNSYTVKIQHDYQDTAGIEGYVNFNSPGSWDNSASNVNLANPVNSGVLPSTITYDLTFQADAADVELKFYGLLGNFASQWNGAQLHVRLVQGVNGENIGNKEVPISPGALVVCGDGQMDPGEECDDGNNFNGDGCSAECLLEPGPEPFCGDDLINQPWEECDGNDPQACTTQDGYSGMQSCADCYWGSCNTDEYCGDSTLNGNEECDDGANGNDADGCYDNCTLTYCGDNIVQSPNGYNEFEECDGDQPQACTTGSGYSGVQTCASCSWSECISQEYCGDTIINNGEQCDDGANGDPTDGCTDNCTLTYCGDDIIQYPNGYNEFEDCDGDQPQACTTGEGYSGTETCMECAWDECSTDEYCGDQTMNGNEECDDGNNVNGDGCNATCILEYCGDIIIQEFLGEECDGDEPQACTTQDGYSGLETCADCLWGECLTEEFCGDNTLNGNEQCDDGNNENGDGCSAECTIESGPDPYCGDGAVNQPGEECDDGNNQDGDGCSAQCTIEESQTASYEITKTLLTTGDIYPGNNIEFQISIENTGDLDIYHMYIYDEYVPYYYEFLSASPTMPDWTDPIGIGWFNEFSSSTPFAVGDVWSRNLLFQINDNGSILHDVTATNTLYALEVIDENDHPLDNASFVLPFDITMSSGPEPYCGDGYLNNGEECDDGNNVNGDGCSAQCTIESGPGPYCGDGNVDNGEECDDGNNENGDGCSAQCTNEGGGGPTCGAQCSISVSTTPTPPAPQPEVLGVKIEEPEPVVLGYKELPDTGSNAFTFYSLLLLGMVSLTTGVTLRLNKKFRK